MAGVLGQTVYTVDSDGSILVENRVQVDSAFPVLPRIGMRTGLPGAFGELSYYGRGPHENYVDRKESTPLAVYRSTVNEQFFPFVDPCECGGHEDVRWLRLHDGAARGLTIQGVPAFHFSALHYTIEDLLQCGHVYELNRTDDVQICIDGYHMGLGGDTGWSRNVHPEYLLRPGTYRYAFRIGPAES